ncbi:unnamed protein product [Darwinula stevensoni]|uniref:Zinc transporter ZIP9 n=1 Tax=Darwinula stevensoni TaxID=69355 RepID=A0A7R8XDT2_9CRUS|nr:unnamed protein product [Darwinula stevensoni]CAG0895095.1 unnamed protein product [Darwinula stevensoni]
MSSVHAHSHPITVPYRTRTRKRQGCRVEDSKQRRWKAVFARPRLVCHAPSPPRLIMATTNGTSFNLTDFREGVAVEPVNSTFLNSTSSGAELGRTVMDDVWLLALLCLAMLLGCFVAGTIPLVFSMSEEKLQLVSVLGAGLLVGTALSVIIPEGVNSLCEVPHTSSLPSGAKNEPASHKGLEPHAIIGMALVFGFVFMLLVDQVSNYCRTRGKDSDAPISVTKSTAYTATLGLVVHAAADGIALGAAASTSHKDTEFIVFIAIMLHKAPAAFGLVTFLLHAGMERNKIRKHLFVFSLAAPLLAIITYFGVGQEKRESFMSLNGTGFAMLFSAGTFLYVSTIHVLPEVSHFEGHSTDSRSTLPTTESKSEAGGNHKGLRGKEVLTLIVGCLLPLLLSVNHHH